MIVTDHESVRFYLFINKESRLNSQLYIVIRSSEAKIMQIGCIMFTFMLSTSDVTNMPTLLLNL